MLVSKFNYIQFTVCSVYACMYIYIYIYRIHYCLIYVYTYNITYMHTYKFYIEYISNNIWLDGYNNNGVCLPGGPAMTITFITFHSNWLLPYPPSLAILLQEFFAKKQEVLIESI